MVYTDHGVPEGKLVAFTRLFTLRGRLPGYGISLPSGEFFSIKQLIPDDEWTWGAFISRTQVATLELGFTLKDGDPVIQGPWAMSYIVVLGNPNVQGRQPQATAYWAQVPLATVPKKEIY